jgi:hypothetical protein
MNKNARNEKPIDGNPTNAAEQVDDWAEAEAALAAAQRMPEGPKRIVALKKAGQLRFRADQRRRAIRDQEMELAAKSRLET